MNNINLFETDEKAEIVCHFCNKKYQFSKQDLQEIIKNIDNQ